MLPRAWCLALALPAVAVVAAAGSPESFDWPQWQGPDRNAVSRERGLLKDWPKEGPPLTWKIKELGGGYSAPSIAAGRIFGTSYRGNEEVVWALSEADGKTQWATPVGPTVSQRMPQGKEGPGCTPTVDGASLFVLTSGGDLVCLQAGDGKIVWRRSLTGDLGGRAPMWSYRESPLVDGDKVICTPGGPDAALVALDKSTGKTIWKCQVPEGESGRARGGSGRGRGGSGSAAYASAIAIDLDGQRQYVQLTANALVGIAASDGKFLWRYAPPANGNRINCSTPLYRDGLVFAASAYGAGGGLVKLVKDGSGGVKAE
jgi:outer membrane protein assembly factor BamB